MALTDNLSFFLELEEASGNRSDSTANGLTFTDNNTVTQNTGKVGNCGQFTSANSEYLSRASETLLQPGPDFTLQVWAYWDSLVSDTVICCKDDVGSNRTFLFGLTGTTIIIYVFDSSSGNANVSESAPSLTTWYHYIFTYSSSDKKGRFIKNNGTASVTGALTNGIKTTGTAAVQIGSRSVSPHYMDGRLDQIGFWKRVLTAEEITALYNGGVGLSYAQMVSDVSFDAASNSGYKTASSTYSWTHVNAGNYLQVDVSMLSVGGSSVTGITYNGVVLTKIQSIASVSGAVRAEQWYLVAPFIGSASIAVTLSAALDSIGNAVSLFNVHQTSPIEGANTATATNVGAADATVNVTTVADRCWVLDCVATDDTAITVGAGQTSRNNVTGALGSGADSTEGLKTPAGSVTMSWTNVAALATWSICAVAVRPLSASGLGTNWGQMLGQKLNRLVVP